MEQHDGILNNLDLFNKKAKYLIHDTYREGEIDLPQISRWTENTPGWYEQTLADDRDHTVDVLWRLTQYAKEAHSIRSNHTDRLYNVIMKKIPAFRPCGKACLTHHRACHFCIQGCLLCTENKSVHLLLHQALLSHLLPTQDLASLALEVYR